MIFIAADLFRIHLLSRDDIYCVRYNEDFVILRFIISRFCSIHFTVTLAGLKKIVRYTMDLVIYNRGSLNRGSTVLALESVLRGVNF